MDTSRQLPTHGDGPLDMRKLARTLLESMANVMWLYLIGRSDESLRALRGKEAPCGTPSAPGSSPRTSGGR